MDEGQRQDNSHFSILIRDILLKKKYRISLFATLLCYQSQLQ